MTPNDPYTHEMFHSSILEQAVIDPTLAEKLKSTPEFIEPLLGLEATIKQFWPYDSDSPAAQAYDVSLASLNNNPVQTLTRSPSSWFTTLIRSISSSSARVTSTDKTGRRISIIQRRQSEKITIKVDPGSATLPGRNTQVFQRP